MQAIEINQIKSEVAINRDHIGRLVTFTERLLNNLDNFERRLTDLEGKKNDAKNRRTALVCVK